MNQLVFDIEADDLLDDVTTIHCVCISSLGSDHIQRFGPNEIWKALDNLQSADEVIGHNILSYDLPALWKICKFRVSSTTKITDTLKLSKLCFPDLQMNDFRSSRKDVISLAGQHGLKAWGIRLNCHKGDFGEEEGAFKEFTPEMLEYCAQDVNLNVQLYKYLMRENPTPESVDLEHRFAKIVENHIHRYGFQFNVEKCLKLCEELDIKTESIELQLQNVFLPRAEEMKTASYYLLTLPDGETRKCKTKGEADKTRKDLKYKPKEVTIERGPNRIKLHQFNPGSRKQIAERLYERYGWESPQRTDPSDTYPEGQPKIDDDTLMMCPGPESEMLIEYLMLKKRLSQIREGDQAWLKCVKPDGRIYHRMDTIGCVTTRCSHHSPNMGQVPSVESKKPIEIEEYGSHCRELFEASGNRKLVGCDLSGIEARMMAHFLYPYDGGKFIDLLLHGDIHQVNADNIECERKPAKNIYYAYMYGAGNFKLQVMHPKRMAGKDIRKRLERGLTGLEDLISTVKKQAGRGYLSPLDGRKLPVRSEHAAFNTLLQGSAAIVMKMWVTLCFEEVKRRGLDARLLACVHDETQAEVIPEHVEEYIDVSLNSIKKAEKHFKLHIPLDGEAKVGLNWKDCH